MNVYYFKQTNANWPIDKMSTALAPPLPAQTIQSDIVFSQQSLQHRDASFSISSVQDPSDAQYLQHKIINLDDVSLSEWLNESIVSPSPPIVLSAKLPHFLPAGVCTSTKLISLGSVLQELKLINERFCEEELVSISIQLLDALAASELYGRTIGKELAGGFVTLDTVMVDESRSNYYLTGCRYGFDKTTHTLIHGRNGALESLYIPPWGIPNQAELRQGMTTRGAFGRVSSSISFWSLAILLCECVLLKSLPVHRVPQQIGAYRKTSPTGIANLIVKLAEANGCSKVFVEFMRSLMMIMPSNAIEVGSYLQYPIIQKYISQWKNDGTHANIIRRYESWYASEELNEGSCMTGNSKSPGS
ncbi:Hypothetical protein GLP15_3473 [Giardia lamblia P15]|uniref:Uncharacterized protein n=1 Tax=Giardia intestinalis (strain P15) TaxID=658858 RepID=E1F0E4_GIAIA|nr:Hypothetical protein GLP15_3473 [Giardia lamblia P15]